MAIKVLKLDTEGYTYNIPIPSIDTWTFDHSTNIVTIKTVGGQEYKSSHTEVDMNDLFTDWK